MDCVVTKTTKEVLTRGRGAYAGVCRYIGALKAAPSNGQAQAMLLLLGVVLICGGLALDAHAQTGLTTTYNDVRISNAVNAVLTYLEGTFGALVMVAAGVGAILSSAFGQYRAALGLLVVAVGAFILRSLLSTFFNDVTVQA